MRPFSLGELVQPLQGTLDGDDARFEAVSTDSREIQPGQLFVALKGEQFDGHRFLADAARAGAGAALVSEPGAAPLPALHVRDTQLALGQLAALNRQYFRGPLLAITGSCGKTTVKNLLAAILCQAGPTLATPGNFNNEIGLPLTLLQLVPEHRYAVVEMGAARAGDIAYLCELANPGIAILLNALPAHLESFGSVDGIARAKGEILAGLSGEGAAVYPAESEYTPLWRELAGSSTRYEFGFERGEVRAEAIDFSAGPGARFRLCTPAGSTALSLRLPGRHNVGNALAAAAAALAAGVSLAQVATGLSAAEPERGRLRTLQLANGTRLIDDSYNANPASVRAAVDVLAALGGRRRLVLGTMAELGPESEQLHAEVGAYAAACGIDQLWATGPGTDQSCAAFGPGAHCFGSRDELLAELLTSLQPGENILVKGSRSAGMEVVVAALEAGCAAVAEGE